MTSDQALSLQSLLLKLATATLGGTWTPSLAAVDDLAIQSSATVDGAEITATLAIASGKFLIFAKEFKIGALTPFANSNFRASGVESLAGLDLDSIAAALEIARASVHKIQLDALAKIEAIRASEAAAKLH